MSKFSKALKKVERKVSNTATKLGVGKDLKKVANVYGAAWTGVAVGAATGFLGGGVPGAIYGGAAGGIYAGVDKYKGKDSSYYLKRSAVAGGLTGLAVGLSGVGVPGAVKSTAIPTPGPLQGMYGENGTVLVKSSSNGGIFSRALTSIGSTIKSAATSIAGKGGIGGITKDLLIAAFARGQGGASTQDGVNTGEGFSDTLRSIYNTYVDPTQRPEQTAPIVISGGTPGDISVAGGQQGPGSGGSIFSSPIFWIVGGLGVLAFLNRKKLRLA